MAEANDSGLKGAVKRLEAEITKAAGYSVPYGTCQVQMADIRVLFDAIKRFGGRKDWTPSPQNLSDLPTPVRAYIIDLERQIGDYQRRLIEAGRYLREMEQGIQRIKHPPR
jgi:hypothetical protein